MSILKDQNEIEIVRKAGSRLAVVLEHVIKKAKAGVTPKELDLYAEKLIREEGDTPAFLQYQPKGALKPYPATLCISVNDHVVHGIPHDAPFKNGDVVGIDIGLFHKGFATDMAKTIIIGGEGDEEARQLLRATDEALSLGIKQARVGNRVGDIGYAIQERVFKDTFSIVQELGGHGIGKKVHEEPFIPNVGEKNKGALLKEDMLIAIEPITTIGSPRLILDKDGYTYKTKDGKRSAHFEHTVLITKDGPEIITKE